MTDRHIPQVDDDDDQDSDNCPETSEVYEGQLDAISDVLDEMEPWDQTTALIQLMIEHLATMDDPDARSQLRDHIVQAIDEGSAELIERMAADRINPTDMDLMTLLMPSATKQ